MNLKNLNDLIKKYEVFKKQLGSREARRMYGPWATSDSLLRVNEFLEDLKKLKKGSESISVIDLEKRHEGVVRQLTDVSHKLVDLDIRVKELERR